jgi:beta-galactosidase
VTPTARAHVRSGQVVQASWQVTVPPDAHPGQVPVTVQAAYTAADQRGVSYGSVSVLGAYAALADAFNNTGISADGVPDSADFDGTGASYSEQTLTAAGLGTGAVLAYGGLTFTWPDAPAGDPDNVIATGQTILLSGAGTTLGFLGAAGSGERGGPGTVYYTDGSTSSFDLTLSSYLGPPGAGGKMVATLPYVNQAGPGGGATGVAGPAYVFYAGVAICPAKTVQAVTLPGRGRAAAGGLHIFAMAIGPLSGTVASD